MHSGILPQSQRSKKVTRYLFRYQSRLLYDLSSCGRRVVLNRHDDGDRKSGITYSANNTFSIQMILFFEITEHRIIPYGL